MKLKMMAACVLVMASQAGLGSEVLHFGPERLVQAGDPPADIVVLGYSVPSYTDWNNDGNDDLIVGEGGNTFTGKVRVYLNSGTVGQPQFSSYFYAQSNGSDLTCTPVGCMGCFPRVVYWDSDGRKDLLVGLADGTVKIFLNVGTDASPTFDGGTFLQVGPAGSKVNIDVGDRATPSFVDWDEDGRRDLVAGAMDSKIHLFINSGSDTEPNFLAQTFVKENGSDLVVPKQRSSPVILDMNDDGKKDILTGNTEGQILFYSNTGSDAEPNFSGYTLAESNGVAIDLAGTPRSRPFVCDWTGDRCLDVLVGVLDGKVHLYEGLPRAGDFEPDADVDMCDFAILGAAWRTQQGDESWNAKCDISVPADNVINELDLGVFAEYWLAGLE